jgi:hypothetical protein
MPDLVLVPMNGTCRGPNRTQGGLERLAPVSLVPIGVYRSQLRSRLYIMDRIGDLLSRGAPQRPLRHRCRVTISGNSKFVAQGPTEQAKQRAFGYDTKPLPNTPCCPRLIAYVSTPNNKAVALIKARQLRPGRRSDSHSIGRPSRRTEGDFATERVDSDSRSLLVYFQSKEH